MVHHCAAMVEMPNPHMDKEHSFLPSLEVGETNESASVVMKRYLTV
jgi:hypothetical protein